MRSIAKKTIRNLKNKKLTLQLSCIFLASISSSLYSQNITDTLCREAETYQLLDQIESDTMLQLEWLTALHFHKIINDYRNEKGKKSIFWDHKLWMAARNHNVFLLRENKYLSHTESDQKLYYSGENPEDRVNFVNYNSKELKYAGYENCNFSGVDCSLDRMNTNRALSISKKEMVELAKETAEEGFEIWKNSMGHNQNMLNADHMAQGTAFILAMMLPMEQVYLQANKNTTNPTRYLYLF